MSSIRNIIVKVSLVMELALLPAFGTFRAHAQFATFDAANFAQMISQIGQDLKSLTIDQETFALLSDKIDNYLKYIELFEKGAKSLSIVADIADAGRYIADDLIYIKDATAYFYSIGASPAVCRAAAECFDEFKTLSSDFMSDFGKMSTMFKKDKTGTDINFLIELDRYMRDYRTRLQALSWRYRSRISSLYAREMRLRQAIANRDFRSLRIY